MCDNGCAGHGSGNKRKKHAMPELELVEPGGTYQKTKDFRVNIITNLPHQRRQQAKNPSIELLQKVSANYMRVSKCPWLSTYLRLTDDGAAGAGSVGAGIAGCS